MTSNLDVLLDGIPVPAVVVDTDGLIAGVNDLAVELTGYETGELVGSHVEVLVPEVSRRAHSRFRSEYVQAPRTRPMGDGRDLALVRRDGAQVPVDIGLGPIETPDGLCILAAIWDATQRQKANETLRAALENEQRVAEELREANRVKSTLLG